MATDLEAIYDEWKASQLTWSDSIIEKACNKFMKDYLAMHCCKVGPDLITDMMHHADVMVLAVDYACEQSSVLARYKHIQRALGLEDE